jgi:hypothetical protein
MQSEGATSKKRGTRFLRRRKARISSIAKPQRKLALEMIATPKVQEAMRRRARLRLGGGDAGSAAEQARCSAEKHAIPCSSSSARSHLENLARLGDRPWLPMYTSQLRAQPDDRDDDSSGFSSGRLRLGRLRLGRLRLGRLRLGKLWLGKLWLGKLWFESGFAELCFRFGTELWLGFWFGFSLFSLLLLLLLLLFFSCFGFPCFFWFGPDPEPAPLLPLPKLCSLPLSL